MLFRSTFGSEGKLVSLLPEGERCKILFAPRSSKRNFRAIEPEDA